MRKSIGGILYDVRVANNVEYLDPVDLSAGIPVTKGRLTTAGGSSTEEFSVAGLLSGQKVSAHVSSIGASVVDVIAVKCAQDGIMEVTFSGDPGNDTAIDYLVFK